MMILIVDKRIPIPLNAGKYQFNPYCEIEDSIAKSFLKAYPNVYHEITKADLASVDINEWSKVDVLKGKKLDEIIKMLSEGQKEDVLNYIKKILSPKEVEPNVSPKKIEDMNISELRSLARKRGIDIPNTFVKKDAILELIKSKETE